VLTLLRDSLGFGGRLLDLLTLRGVGRQGDQQIPEIIHPKSPSRRFLGKFPLVKMKVLW